MLLLYRRGVIKSTSCCQGGASYSLVKMLSSEPDRPFTLPSQEYRPKQSLGQNFLSDQNYVKKIVNVFQDDSEGGERVVELGPGAGAITRELIKKYPKMGAVEIDTRSIHFLQQKLPSLSVTHQDVLKVNWTQEASQRGGRLNLIGNLPFYITSQILFTLCDHHNAVKRGVFTTQLEVGQRIVSRPNSKPYGILAVVFQLYCEPKLHFTIPSTVFYPQPKVQSALISLDFMNPHKDLQSVNGHHLRKVITRSFGKRRKILRQSLKELLVKDELTLPDKWMLKRPQELSPGQFLELTADLYGTQDVNNISNNSSDDNKSQSVDDNDMYIVDRVWRTS